MTDERSLVRLTLGRVALLELDDPPLNLTKGPMGLAADFAAAAANAEAAPTGVPS